MNIVLLHGKEKKHMWNAKPIQDINKDKDSAHRFKILILMLKTLYKELNLQWFLEIWNFLNDLIIADFNT